MLVLYVTAQIAAYAGVALSIKGDMGKRPTMFRIGLALLVLGCGTVIALGGTRE